MRRCVRTCFVHVFVFSSVLLGQMSDSIKIKAIRIVALSETPNTYSVYKPEGFESIVRIDLEHDADQFDVLVSLLGKNANLRMEQRYVTSLSVQNEGPRLDLVNWKHFVSNWVAMKPNPNIGDRFRSLIITREESIRFPEVEFSSVIEEIRRQDPKWLEVVKIAKTISEYPFDISVSCISFRISAFIDGKWVPLHIVHCMRPMGC